jgi:hypothetical protein
MDDNTGVNKIYTYQEKVDYSIKQIVLQTKVYGDLIERIATLERTVRGACMDYMQANPESKKISLEKMEIVACTSPALLREHYLELVFLRVKQHNLEKVIEASQSTLSACQSVMKYDRPYDRP